MVSQEFNFEIDAALDDVPHDVTIHERRELQLRNRLHIMTVEGNNMEHYLLAFMQRHRRAATLIEIITLYERHAPFIEAPGTYPHNELIGHTSAPDGVLRYFLRETSNEYGDTEMVFDTQMGLFSFRNRRMVTREDSRLSEAEVETRLMNLYHNLRLLSERQIPESR